MTNETYRPYVQHQSGNKLWLDNLDDNKYNINDIAHSLANQCRYAGHCDIYYSVAQHSVLCSQMCYKEVALEALMHDCGESVMPDIARPVKYFIPGIREFDDRISASMFKYFNLQWPLDTRVHEVDNRMLATEARQFMSNSNIDEWDVIGKLEPYKITITSWRPEFAKQMFLDRYQYLLARKAFAEEGLGDNMEDSVAIGF